MEHPRVSGEDGKISDQELADSGTPPRRRGGPSRRRAGPLVVWNIPASAGVFRRRTPRHPRTRRPSRRRGGVPTADSMRSSRAPSSPPTRGFSAPNRRDVGGVAHPVRRDVAAGLQLVRQTADCTRHVFSRTQISGARPAMPTSPCGPGSGGSSCCTGRGRRFSILIGEMALRSLICPPAVLTGQLECLAGLVGLDAVALG